MVSAERGSASCHRNEEHCLTMGAEDAAAQHPADEGRSQGMVRPRAGTTSRSVLQQEAGLRLRGAWGLLLGGALAFLVLLSASSGSGSSEEGMRVWGNEGLRAARPVVLESRGALEYETAQARAHLAADKVDLRNSAAKLRALNSLIASRKGKDDAQPFMVKGKEGTALEDVKAKDENAEILQKAMLQKAAHYEYKADEEAASVADAHLKGKKLSKAEEEQDTVTQEDDQLFARKLRRIANKGHSKEVAMSKQMKLFLNQYHNGYQLRMGRLKEEATYHNFQDAVKTDKEKLQSLLKQEATAQPSTKVDIAEQEAMAIESLGKAVGN